MQAVLSRIDSFTRRMVPLDLLVDLAVTRLLPAERAAACGGVYCQTCCCLDQSTGCYTVVSCPSQIDYYAGTFAACESGAYNCTHWNGQCCGGGACQSCSQCGGIGCC